MASDGRSIFSLACHLRSLIKPSPGRAIAYLDFVQQEFGIAAYMSGDLRMMEAYRSGDAYLQFAKQAAAVPADATADSHETIRALFKTCALGVQYGMGFESLAYRINDSFGQARELLRLHRDTYPHYWEWSRACVDYATAYGHLTASFGWRVHVSTETKPTTLRNFLLQANGSEMLRWACVLCSQRGLPICFPVHDALLIEDDIGRIDATVAAVRQAMIDASEIILPGFPLRVDSKIFRWPDRYSDKRGVKMWERVWRLIDGDLL
jgi:DNA polymerase I-like protein with 3'-5' exonuclease and polymerase domains